MSKSVLQPAFTQTVAYSFDKLRNVVRAGRTDVVTDEAARVTKGRVVEVSRESFVVETTNRDNEPERRAFVACMGCESDGSQDIDSRGGHRCARILLMVMLVFLTSAHAAAQGTANRGELFAGGGGSRVGGDEGSLGSGAYVFGGAGYRVASRVSVEVDVMRAQHERDIAGGPLEGTATGVFGSMAYYFSEGTTQPFVMGSAGLLRSETTHTFPFGGTPTTFTSDTTDFAWGGGAGVSFFFTARFSLRPQVRVVFSEATGVMGLIAASIGLGYRW